MSADTVLWFNPAVGVAGDMVLGSLLAVGAEEKFVRDQLSSLGVEGWRLEVAAVTRRSLTATAALVSTDETHHHRTWSAVEKLLASAGLEPEVRCGATETFRALAEAEGRVHGIDPADVHFHEVGALDALVDVVGSWAALVSLGSPRVVSAPVGLGTATVAMAHGTVPVPAPAVLELLRDRPATPVEAASETATPTGVALLVAMASEWGNLPAGTVREVGRGAGTRDPVTHANVLTAVLCDPAPTKRASEHDAVVIETNLDDATPEVLGHTITRALASGAEDAWVVPITMKKSRAAHQVRILCRPANAEALRELLAAETGTLGVRQWTITKYEWPRRIEVADVDGHPVRIKVGPHGAKPEHDDVAAVAKATRRSYRNVAADALSRLEPPS